MIIVHFEVYVLEGRGWMLHARFPRLERDEAIREAKELEYNLGLQVKVVRETYNTDQNSFDESEVYKSSQTASPKKKKGAPGTAAGRTGAGSARGGGGTSAQRGGTARTAAGSNIAADVAGLMTVLSRLMVVLLISVGLALGALRLVPPAVSYLYDFGFRITPDDYGQLLFAVFIGVALMTGVPLGLRMMPLRARISLRGSGPPRRGAPPAQTRPTPDASVKKALNKLAKEAGREQIPDKWADDDLVEETPPPLQEILPEILPDPEDIPPPLLADPEETAPPAPNNKGRGEKDDAPPSSGLGAASKVAERFSAAAEKIIRQNVPQMDKYTLFGLNLYMAGAIQSLAFGGKLNSAAQRKLLTAIITRLGTSADQADAFYDKISDYAREGRYGRMVIAGREAMDAWSAGDEMTPQIKLQGAIKDWNKPASEKKPSIMTIMFTDMVGSTDLTQARGDVAAQEVVRKHNTIVRTALTQFAGHEVKHTGDGIMASFASAANAVDATIQIQRQVALHNQRLPNLPLHLRIGLNSGEPIQEEDDLFGSTVQLAARVCAATQSDQTLCTQVVKDLTGAKSVSWGDAGLHSLKGFRDKFHLWDIPWQG